MKSFLSEAVFVTLGVLAVASLVGSAVGLVKVVYGIITEKEPNY